MSGYALVGDPDQDLALRAAAVLRECGFDATTAHDAAAVRAAIDARLPDIVVLDADMADTDGVPLLERLKAGSPQASIPIIAVSAGTSPDAPLTAYQRGADYHLAKPYTRRQLLHGLALVLGRDFGG